MKAKTLQNKLSESLSTFKDHIAIRYGTQTMTYGDLDKKSDYIANWLINKGIKKETFTGILIHDRIQFICTMIGILKARCVFVPLDSTHPKNRLEVMINSTGTPLVFIDNVNLTRFEFEDSEGVKEQQAEFIRIEDLLSGDNRLCSSHKKDVQYSRGDKIYIYFTSGTTGTPKAFVGKNKSLLHFVDWEIATLGLDQTLRCSQFTTPGFDAFLRDVFVPLCCGGSICIPGDEEIMLESQGLATWIETSGIGLIHCVPGLFRLLSAAKLTPRHFSNLKFILLSGEKINPPDLVKWYETFDERIQLVNLWGTSETTLAKTAYFIRKSDIQRERIPVGKPIPGARVIIMDRGMNVCKQQIVGILYIRTPYRTFGYYNDPRLNRERFIQNPFNPDPEDLLHRTGDLGRLLPDGNLELLGRDDRQVKIRGIRIELEEIESVLRKHPKVEEAVVVKKVTTGDGELLCGYITRGEEGPRQDLPIRDRLRDYLSEELPAYMVPAVIQVLEKIPRNPNGKIDYEALPDPLSEQEKECIPPRHRVEEKLLECWTEVLGIHRIGINSNFFQLGGNSLSVMSLISKIHREFDIRIPLGKIFNNATIEKQAKIIKEEKKDKYISIEPVEKKEYYSLSSAQQRLYILYRMDKESISYNMPAVLELEGDLEKEVIEKSFRRLINRHESFRTAFRMLREEPVQKIYEPQDLEFTIEYHEIGEPGAEVLKKQFIRPFVLSKAPLLRVGIIKIGQRRYVLKVDVHHIVSDGTSTGILIKDFMAFYRGKELQGLRIQYKDFSEWQGELIASGEMAKQEKYWLKQYEGEIPVVNLPLDYPRPTKPDFEGNNIVFELDHQLTGAINGLVSETGTTLHILLLAVYIVLLSKYSGQEDIVVGFGIAGRTHTDLDNVVGMFVNMMAMRSRPLASLSFFEFIMEVKENSINAYENQDYQFEELVRKLGIQRDFGRNPLFDAVFSFQNMKTSRAELPHLHIKPSSFEYKVTQFDLALVAFQSNGKIVMILDYLTALFKPSTVQRMTKHYVEIMKQLVENKNIKLKDISLSYDLSTGKSKLNQRDVIEFEYCL